MPNLVVLGQTAWGEQNERYLHIILYADDILLLAPSVTQLEKLLRKCEEELSYLDMVINVKKSACLRVGLVTTYVVRR